MENKTLKSSEDWQKECEKFVEVIDPNGWDRANMEASWAEPITKAEFCRRVTHSTLSRINAKEWLVWSQDKYCPNCTHVAVDGSFCEHEPGSIEIGMTSTCEHFGEQTQTEKNLREYALKHPGWIIKFIGE